MMRKASLRQRRSGSKQLLIEAKLAD